MEASPAKQPDRRTEKDLLIDPLMAAETRDGGEEVARGAKRQQAFLHKHPGQSSLPKFRHP